MPRRKSEQRENIREPMRREEITMKRLLGFLTMLVMALTIWIVPTVPALAYHHHHHYNNSYYYGHRWHRTPWHHHHYRYKKYRHHHYYYYY
jgi:hypothetical protein